MLLAAALHQIAKGRFGCWAYEAYETGSRHDLGYRVLYPDLRNPYHHSSNEMRPDSVRAVAEDDGDELGRRFADEDLIRWVVRDVDQSFQQHSWVFVMDALMKEECREHGGRAN